MSRVYLPMPSLDGGNGLTNKILTVRDLHGHAPPGHEELRVICAVRPALPRLQPKVGVGADSSHLVGAHPALGLGPGDARHCALAAGQAAASGRRKGRMRLEPGMPD